MGKSELSRDQKRKHKRFDEAVSEALSFYSSMNDTPEVEAKEVNQLLFILFLLLFIYFFKKIYCGGMQYRRPEVVDISDESDSESESEEIDESKFFCFCRAPIDDPGNQFMLQCIACSESLVFL
jgi:hypothetical protein